MRVASFGGQGCRVNRRSYVHVQGLRHRRVDDALSIHQIATVDEKGVSYAPRSTLHRTVARMKSGRLFNGQPPLPDAIRATRKTARSATRPPPSPAASPAAASATCAGRDATP